MMHPIIVVIAITVVCCCLPSPAQTFVVPSTTFVGTATSRSGSNFHGSRQKKVSTIDVHGNGAGANFDAQAGSSSSSSSRDGIERWSKQQSESSSSSSSPNIFKRRRISRTQVKQSAVAIDFATTTSSQNNIDVIGFDLCDVPAELREPAYHHHPKGLQVVYDDMTPKNLISEQSTATSSSNSQRVSKTDLSLSITLFCTILVTTFSIVLLPSVAADMFPTNKIHQQAFVAAAASMAPLGGCLGKLVNGFVCERFGGQKSSAVYMLAMAGLSLALAGSSSTSTIGWLLAGLEFLSSIQWTSACAVLNERSSTSSTSSLDRSIGLLSAAMAVGALAAKLAGTALLSIWPWRRIALAAAMASIVGAGSMIGMGKEKATKTSSSSTQEVAAAAAVGPITSATNTLRSSIFWQIGIAHCVGYLVRSSDILLGPFTAKISSLSVPICAALSSSVALGFVHGMFKGNKFSAMSCAHEQTRMIRGNYRTAAMSATGLAILGLGVVGQQQHAAAGLATACSGLLASCVAFQYFQIPSLVARTVFAKHSSVSLSLMDAVAFLVTAQAMTVNRFLLGRFGWSASWMFLAGIVGVGGILMDRAMPKVLGVTSAAATTTNNDDEFLSDEYLFQQVFSG